MIAGGHGQANPNATWLDARGFWVFYLLFVVFYHLVLLSIPMISIPLVSYLSLMVD
jgi:hypothetical protein